MHHHETDVLVAGGGVAGLIAAAAFGGAGLRTVCVDPAPPVTEADDEGADLRTTALLQPSVALLEEVGLWKRLAPHATPLQVMRIVEAGGAVAEPRKVRDFDAAEISDQPFGWNLPNWLLRRELVAHLEGLAGVTFRPGSGVARVLGRESAALVTLSDASRLRARLLVGADGRNSVVRRAMGIKVQTWRYGQKALAFAVTHTIPHRNVSTEIHRSGGPFTLVPLPDHAGKPCSAVVWMERGPEIRRLLALEPEAFEQEMSERSAYLYGPLRLASRLTVWPIISQVADRLAAERTAFMAEAAHVVPPIGAQGLNMSLADLATLLDLAHPSRLGDLAMLDAYHRRRWPEVRARVAGIDLLNRASMAGTPLLAALREHSLDALYAPAPLRQGLMRLGMGLR